MLLRPVAGETVGDHDNQVGPVVFDIIAQAGGEIAHSVLCRNVEPARAAAVQVLPDDFGQFFQVQLVHAARLLV